MKTLFTNSRLLFVAASAVFLGAFCPSVSAEEFVPLKLRGTVTIQSMVPVGGDENVVTVEIVATDAGWGAHFGHYTSVLHLVVDIDLATGLPLRGGGVVVQTNADGSTVTWLNHFEGAQIGSTITGGTRRFENAEGWVEGVSVLNTDGTFSYDEKGWITSIGSNLGAQL